MSKESIDKLKDFLRWVVIFIGCMLIGIMRTYAITFTDFTDVHSNTTLYVGYSDNGNPISWPFNNSSLYQRNIISMDYVVNTNITGGVHYEFESHMLGQYFLSNAIYNVVDAGGNSCLTDSYYLNFLTGEYPRWDFQCPNNSNGFTIHIQQSNNGKLFNDGYMGWGSAILSKTSTPISSTGNDTQEIIDNANANANAIIDNQNNNTQQIIDNQNNLFLNKCANLFNLSTVITGSGINTTNGGFYNNSVWSRSDFIKVNPNTNYLFYSKGAYQLHLAEYSTNSASGFISLTNNDRGNISVTTSSNTQFIVVAFRNDKGNSEYMLQEGNVKSGYCEYGKTSNKIDSITEALTDDSPVDVSGLGNTVGWLPPGPIDSIINLPLEMDNTLIDAIGGTCVPLHIPLPYVNRYLDVPCISTLMEQMGFKTFWNWVGTIASVIILYRYLLNLYKYYDDLTTLKANFISDFGGAP